MSCGSFWAPEEVFQNMFFSRISFLPGMKIFLNLFSRQLCIQNPHSCVRLISSQYFAYTPEQLPNYRQHGRPRECTWRFLVVYHCNIYSSYRGSIAYTPSSAPRSPVTSSTRKDAKSKHSRITSEKNHHSQPTALHHDQHS